MISHSVRQHLISLLDLTSLNENDNESTIDLLCTQATTPYGKVAAVCIYPQYVSLAHHKLRDKAIHIATVCNFPDGSQNLETTLLEIQQATTNGADEIDLVLPYYSFLQDKQKEIQSYLANCRSILNPNQRLKIILETGSYLDKNDIALATRLAIESGAHFIKTSTGKIPIGATPEAADVIFKTIKSINPNVGFKASGGVRHIEDALIYLRLAEKWMGESWVQPEHFRIGASRLLHDLLK